MGASISSNVSKSMQNTAITAINELANACTVDLKTDVTFNVTNDCKVGGKVTVVNEGTQVTLSCIQNTVTSNTFKNQLASSLQQQAQLVSQSLGMPNAQITNQLIQATQQISEEVNNSVKNTCFVKQDNNFVYNCSGKGSEINTDILVSNKNTKYGIDCSQRANLSNKIDTIVKSQLKNSTTIKEANALGGVLVIFALILLVGVYFSLQELNGPIGYLIVFGIIGTMLATAIYSWLAPKRGYYPYKS